MSLRPSLAVITAAIVLGTGIVGQQPNTPGASMVWNGTDGPPWPIQAIVYANAPTITLAFSGVPNQGYALVQAYGGVLSSGYYWNGGFIDVDLLGGFLFVMDGLGHSTGSVLDWLANTGPTGVSTWSVPITPAAVGFSGGFQAVFFDPTAPYGLRLSAATSLSIVPVPFGPSIFVSATTGSDTNSGTSAAPLATIAAGVAAATLGAAPAVRVAAGTYTEAATVVVPNGLAIVGGYTPGAWTPGGGTSSLTVATHMAISVTNAPAPTLIEELTIAAAGGTGTGQTASSYGIFAVNSSGLQVKNCVVHAGDGAPGVDGQNAASLAPAPVGATGALGGSGCGSHGFACLASCNPGPAGPGGAGGVNPGVGNGLTGGMGGGYGFFSGSGGSGSPSGGVPGGSGCPSGLGNWNPSIVHWGVNGIAGADGANGQAGTGTCGVGGYATTAAWPGAAGTGGTGGGGGGGGGGGMNPCGAAYGGGGGGGGGGGAPGAPGTGAGVGGGASIAIYLWASHAMIDSCQLHTGNGGVGGNGGYGQPGGLGGLGAHVGATNAGNFYGGSSDQGTASNGARGGDGAAGGAGGAGGGSAGGPSIGVCTAGGSAPVLIGTNVIQVGAGGAGGAGGIHGNGAPGTSGAAGVAITVGGC